MYKKVSQSTTPVSVVFERLLAIRKHFFKHFLLYGKDPQGTISVRRVFNGLLAIRDGLSLNDCTLKGQALTPHIAKVFLQLRLKQYLLTNDVGHAFLCGIPCEYTLGILCEYNRILCEYSPFFIKEDWIDPEYKVLSFRFRKRMASSVKMVSSGLFGLLHRELDEEVTFELDRH